LLHQVGISNYLIIWCDMCRWLSWRKEMACGDDVTPEDKEDDTWRICHYC